MCRVRADMIVLTYRVLFADAAETPPGGAPDRRELAGGAQASSGKERNWRCKAEVLCTVDTRAYVRPLGGPSRTLAAGSPGC